ncbi:MAG: methyltransferase domain-containing protein [Planctomycetota bacterium]|nr:methyltransferase domain-containing protein [Planctomycetota bacterium]
MSDPYTNLDHQTQTTLDAIAIRLEERGSNPIFQRMIDDYLSVIPTNKPIKILDLGCGTGVVTRKILDHVGIPAKVCGADLSGQLLEKARELDSSRKIEWIKVDSESSPFETASFDFVVMHTLLSHVPDLVPCLKDAARILKKGGQLIIFDADYASVTFGYPDFEKMRAIDLKLLAGLVTHLDVCRQLPRHLKAAGFELKSHKSYLLSEAGEGDYWLSSVKSFAKLIPSLNILPEAEGAAWVAHMLKSQDEGTFFAAGAYYTYFARPISS